MITVPAAPAWQEEANCQGIDTEEFFPEKGGRNELAQRICRRCPVTDKCLQWALDRDELGVWGGTTEHERRQMKRRPQRVAV